MRSVERWAITSLAIVALVMFVFPVVSAKTPRGTRTQSGYDIALSLGDAGGRGESTAAGDQASPARLPVSLRFVWLVPVSVGLAFLAALVCVAGGWWSLKIARVASRIGGAFAVLAVLHIRVSNADMHSFLQAQLDAPGGEASVGLSGDIGGGLAGLLAGSVSWSPDVGLYVLMACLLAMALVSHARMHSRLGGVNADRAAN